MTSATQTLRADAQVIGLVGLGHGTSHFFHLLLAPLFPWLKEAFGLSYAELGLLMTVFFIVSGVGQALAGFVVDRIGALPVLLGGLAFLCISALGLAAANSYVALMLFAAVAGVGNSVFHPADFTVLNRRVSTPRLGHAFSMHGLSGALGWAAAPVFLAGIATLSNWRVALLAAAALAFAVLAVLFVCRDLLDPGEVSESVAQRNTGGSIGDSLQFLRLNAVWMCFAFFLVASLSFGGIQSFAPAALRDLYSVPFTFATACITAYMLASAGGLIVGGFAAARTQYHDRVIAVALTVSGSAALLVALGSMPAWIMIPMLAILGFGAGLAGPSRDLLVRAAAPGNAIGRVYGVVYSGMDIGLAIAPPIYGALMDASRPAWVFILMGSFHFAAIVTAIGVGEHTVRSTQPA
ncbi:MAG: MFS transporter [Betaproteobacteria bacterium]|nr:MAG: MFS transporter [Betaproteobacteria bacterium]